MTLKNDLYIRALLRQPTERTPAWMMRQAGRYLPEYMAIRSQAGSFLDLCKNPELACEVTIQPLRRYSLDAAILFSDILTIPDALGLGLYFTAGEGPRFERPITSAQDIAKLGLLDVQQDLGYVCNTVSLIVNELNNSLPLIGFSGSPWTLATYMVEGGPSKNFEKVKCMMFNNPNSMHALLDNLANNVAAYLNAQIERGVNAVQIFDTWGGVLGHREYEEFSLRYMQKVIELLNRNYNGKKIPVVVFTKGGGIWLEQIAKCGCDAVGLDWTIDLGKARQILGDSVAIQGNMDPIRLLSPNTVAQEVQRIVTDYSNGADFCSPKFNRGHIFNLGHGIVPSVDPATPQIMLDALNVATYRKL